ncbi:SCO2400 family protein [Streptomyces galbus]|uniref:Uncharacterized protein n=1 Tax=Streptomyces galbus TaxID=33898 RepID=A0A4U5X846_STRGB|nr:hypothetical protein [Streptomyces galbus]TKT11110.1 hypothetical protein E4U92_03000 [Streptomyces galbus]GHD29853.1 hypothetical protein GCM10010335_19310 [Streptomyces galbus]
MDYCHPCRRHLNGALACPGCGAPVDRTYAYAQAPEGYTGRTHEGQAHPTGAQAEAPEPGPRVPHQRSAPEDAGPGEAGLEDASGPAPHAAAEETAESASARLSRRDRKAAVHRRRRRRTVLIVAGFVLAAGGLSLAELGIDAPGFSSSDPAAAGGEAAELADGDSPSPGGSDRPVDGPRGTGTTSASPSASASASASPSASASASASPSGSTSPDPQSATAPGTVPAGPGTDPDQGTDPAPDPTPTTEPTTAEPTPKPSPSPTKTCDRFLWWCT